MLQQIINETPIEITVIINGVGDTTTQAIYDERPSPLDDMGMEKNNNLVTVQVAADDVEDLANIGDTNQAICDRDDDRAIHLDDTGMEKNNCLFTVPPNTTTRKKGKEKTAPKSSLVQSVQSAFNHQERNTVHHMSSHLSDQSIYAFHYDKRKSDESDLQVQQEMPRDNNLRERRIGVVDLGHEVRVGDACPGKSTFVLFCRVL